MQLLAARYRQSTITYQAFTLDMVDAHVGAVLTSDMVEVGHVRQIRGADSGLNVAAPIWELLRHYDTLRTRCPLSKSTYPEVGDEETTPPGTSHVSSTNGAQRRGASTKSTNLNLVRFAEDQQMR
jgi:hypothetical protein